MRDIWKWEVGWLCLFTPRPYWSWGYCHQLRLSIHLFIPLSIHPSFCLCVTPCPPNNSWPSTNFAQNMYLGGRKDPIVNEWPWPWPWRPFGTFTDKHASLHNLVCTITFKQNYCSFAQIHDGLITSIQYEQPCSWSSSSFCTSNVKCIPLT